jgi:hypothetical protein
VHPLGHLVHPRQVVSAHGLDRTVEHPRLLSDEICIHRHVAA